MTASRNVLGSPLILPPKQISTLVQAHEWPCRLKCTLYNVPFMWLAASAAHPSQSRWCDRIFFFWNVQIPLELQCLSTLAVAVTYLVPICCLERLIGNRSDPSSKIFDEFCWLWAPGIACFDGDCNEGMHGGDLLTVTFSTAVQDVVEISWRCDATYVSGTATFQARGLLRVHGTRVAPLTNRYSNCFIRQPEANGCQRLSI